MAGNASGVAKTSAKRIGLSLEEYQHRLGEGEKWCHGCAAWHQRSAFNVDRSRGDGLTATCVLPPTPVHLQDSKGGDWDEWPWDLRVREFPA